MSWTTTSAGDYLKLIYNATTIANFAINATSSPNTQVFVSLHTASPGASGTQATNEAAYPSYARVAVNRNTGGWTVTSNAVSPVANISFPASTGSPSETETFMGVGVATSGATELMHYGAISPTIAVTAAGITPVLTTATAITGT